jgi:hypothetical protein
MTEINVPTLFKNGKALQAWVDDIKHEIAEITSEILPLQQRLDAAHEKLDLVQRLIHLSATNTNTLPKNTDKIPKSSQVPVLPGIEDRIEEILTSSGKPMHISELRDKLIQMGVPLPGRGDEANIILRLRRASDRFMRTERGTYALNAWNLPEYSPTTSRKRVHKRRRTLIP